MSYGSFIIIIYPKCGSTLRHMVSHLNGINSILILITRSSLSLFTNVILYRSVVIYLRNLTDIPLRQIHSIYISQWEELSIGYNFS